MSGFDIDSFLRFTPPRCLCQKCCAINSITIDTQIRAAVCSVCGLRYISGAALECYEYLKHLAGRDMEITFRDVIGQCRSLARISDRIRNKGWLDHWACEKTLLALLLSALSEAKHFIHIATYGVSWMMLGALKLAAQRVEVRLILSRADAFSVEELTAFAGDAPKLSVQIYGESPNAREDVPHQKLVVVDGLLAFKGSTNFTHQAWRKAEKGMDVVEVVTDLAEVSRLNNSYFSPIWSSASNLGTTLALDSIPF